MKFTAKSALLLILIFLSSGYGFAQVLKNDRDNNQDREKEFIVFDSNYLQHKQVWLSRIKVLGLQLFSKEATAKQNIECQHQLFSELIWLITCTADNHRIDASLSDLEAQLKQQNQQTAIVLNSKQADCNTEWFFKLTAHYDDLRKNTTYAYLLDTINSPAKLTKWFERITTSDISKTGIDHEREFNESLSNLMRLILRGQPAGYPYHPQLRQTMINLILNDFRNPETGYWGERYVRNGRLVFIDNISITFHVLSYLNNDIPDLNKYLPNGVVPDLDKVLKTTLAIKHFDIMAGWLYKGQYWNHISMDVVQLLRLCWPIANAAQKKEISIELDKMLKQCLTESLQADGSFKPIEADGSIEECTYFGESFLTRIGFFDPSKRFWTTKTFPEAEGIRQKMIAFIKQHLTTGATGGEYYRSALSQLEGKD